MSSFTRPQDFGRVSWDGCLEGQRIRGSLSWPRELGKDERRAHASRKQNIVNILLQKPKVSATTVLLLWVISVVVDSVKTNRYVCEFRAKTDARDR